MTILPANIVIFIGIFLILEAIFSIVYYFKGNPLPHIFRVIRAIFGSYLIYKGVNYSLFKYEALFWSQVTFFIIISLSILSGYEVAKVLEKGKEKKKDEENGISPN